MKKVWIQFKGDIEADERLRVIERINRLVKTASTLGGKAVAVFASDGDQEHFDRQLATYVGKGRPILLQTDDAAELQRILDVDFPGLCTVVDAPP